MPSRIRRARPREEVDVLGGMMLFWALLLIVIFVVLFRLVPEWPGTPPYARQTPLEQLQCRYARGEISTAEYEQRSHRLRQTRGHMPEEEAPL